MVNASELEADLLRLADSNGGGPLTIDAEHLRFIDSQGIAALLRVHEVLDSEGRQLHLVKLPPPARRVVDILNLKDTLGVVNGS